jgi:hypothetical protein
MFRLTFPVLRSRHTMVSRRRTQQLCLLMAGCCFYLLLFPTNTNVRNGELSTSGTSSGRNATFYSSHSDDVPTRASATSITARSRYHIEESSKYDFEIIVLAMNRPETLQLLLQSLEATDFNDDLISLTIRFDHHVDQVGALSVAEKFVFSHGTKSIHRGSSQIGLAQAWFNAWQPKTEDARAIILEDDIVLSHSWYSWLTFAWGRCDNLEHVAGVSLMRQSLIPKQPHEQREIENNNSPFLFSLLGSIAFSPSPRIWLEFRDWLDSIDLSEYDVSTPGLITSEWWNRLDKRNIWTQHFVYFTLLRDLYTMYINLPNKQTLASHLRAKGAHFDGSQGADFDLGFAPSYSFPAELQRYGWDGKPITEQLDLNPENGIDIIHNVMIQRAHDSLSKNDHIAMIFIDRDHLSTVHQALDLVGHNSRNEVLIVSSDFSVARDILRRHPDLLVFTQNTEHINVEFGVIFDVECPYGYNSSPGELNLSTLVKWRRP